MAVLKCKMCGDNITVTENQTYGTCESCGSTMTLPKISDDRTTNLFNRANHLRLNGDFDRAIATYENLLNEDNSDAEAHWGLVLSRYGIEYVKDPVSQQRIPTCHRAQVESIMIDSDFQAAMNNAPDNYTRTLYEYEAKRISYIQKEILAISANEKPYDVFICYKETDDLGGRTVDSTLAQEVYYQLENSGYKVFFSRITLEDKLGQQYEPYIFAALHSAKVMVLIGTKSEYFNAIWVKNEWSRYLSLMKTNRSRLLIPCYRGIDPYDLPEALSMLQSQDMSKIGFMQDLIRGVEKVLSSQKEKTKPSVERRIIQDTSSPTVTSLLKRANIFLEDGDLESANEYFEKVLDLDPECANAYEGKFKVDVECISNEDIINKCNYTDIATNNNFTRAVRFGSNFNEIFSQEIFVAAWRDRKYSEALSIMEKAKDSELKVEEATKYYAQAIEIFYSLGDFNLSKEKAAQCEYEKISLVYSLCLDLIRAIESSKATTTTKIKQMNVVIDKLKVYYNYKEVREKIEECEKYKSYIAEIKNFTWNSSTSSFQVSAEKFLSLGDFKDSVEYYNKCLAAISKYKNQKIIMGIVLAVLAVIIIIIMMNIT